MFWITFHFSQVSWKVIVVSNYLPFFTIDGIQLTIRIFFEFFFTVRGHSNNTWHFLKSILDPLPPHLSFGDTGMDPLLLPLWRETFSIFQKRSFFNGFQYRNVSYFFPKTVHKGQKMPRDVLVNPLPPSCVIYWHSCDPPAPLWKEEV